MRTFSERSTVPLTLPTRMVLSTYHVNKMKMMFRFKQSEVNNVCIPQYLQKSITFRIPVKVISCPSHDLKHFVCDVGDCYDPRWF